MSAGRSNWNGSLQGAVDLQNNLLHYTTSFLQYLPCFKSFLWSSLDADDFHCGSFQENNPLASYSWQEDSFYIPGCHHAASLAFTPPFRMTETGQFDDADEWGWPWSELSLTSELDFVLHWLSHVKSFGLLAELCIRPEMNLPSLKFCLDCVRAVYKLTTLDLWKWECGC